eukprot:1379484-Amorphochlora_amoeboformis.AAC.1
MEGNKRQERDKRERGLITDQWGDRSIAMKKPSGIGYAPICDTTDSNSVFVKIPESREYPRN